MRPRARSIGAILMMALISSCGDEDFMNAEVKEYPEFPEIYNDGKAPASAPSLSPTPSPVQSAHADFECVKGAASTLASLPHDPPETRAEDGATVTYYNPEGVLVFGMQAMGLEHYRSPEGDEGLAVYLTGSRPDILAAIMRVHRTATLSEGALVGDTIDGRIELGDATNGQTRVSCRRVAIDLE